MNLLASRHYAAEGRCFVIAVGALLRRRDLALADSSVLPEDPDALLLDGGTTIIGDFLTAYFTPFVGSFNFNFETHE